MTERKDMSLPELIVADGDHDTEVGAFNAALIAVCDKYWFIGRNEIVGGLERIKYHALRCWEGRDDGGRTDPP